MTQVDRAIAALLEGWLSPRQLSAVSGRVNPNGLIRDARLEAARRGLVWREVWVRNERGRRFKMHHLERSGSLARPACPGGVPPSSNAAGSAVPGSRVAASGDEAGMRRNHERVSVGTPSYSPDTLAGDPQGGPVEGKNPGRPSSPSRWQDRVGVSGAARATGGAQGELWEERG